MNPYEESELGERDLYCKQCGCLISVDEYLEYDRFCEDCSTLNEEE